MPQISKIFWTLPFFFSVFVVSCDSRQGDQGFRTAAPSSINKAQQHISTSRGTRLRNDLTPRIEAFGKANLAQDVDADIDTVYTTGSAFKTIMVTDMTTIDTLFQNDIAKPLGLTCSAFIKTDCVGAHKVSGHKNGEVSNDGWPRSFPDDTPLTFGAAGRLHTNADDYARFMVALMEGEGLKPALSDEMFKEQVQLPADSETRRLTGETAWGLGIAIEPTPYGIHYEHGGNNGDFQSGMMFFRDKKLGYVFMTNSDRGEEFNKRLERYITEAE